MDRLPLKPGQKPLVVWLRHPTPSVRRYFQGLTQSPKGYMLAMRKIAQLSVVKADPCPAGTNWKTTDPDMLCPCVPDAAMDMLDEVTVVEDGKERKGKLVDDIADAVIKSLNRPS